MRVSLVFLTGLLVILLMPSDIVVMLTVGADLEQATRPCRPSP